MNVSSSLQAQIDRLTNTGSFNLNAPLKRELQRIVSEIGVNSLDNLNCGVCLRNALYDVARHQKEQTKQPVLQMKMVKDLSELSWVEIKQHAKDKGIKIHAKKREQLETEIKEANG